MERSLAGGRAVRQVPAFVAVGWRLLLGIPHCHGRVAALAVRNQVR